MSIASDISTSSALNTESVVQACGLHPLVAVLTSTGADGICKKNNLSSFADLLAPFSSVTYVIKDPAGINLSAKVKIDFRDVAKNGCLWSLTVLPSVLDQVVSLTSTTESTEDIWAAGFRDAFCYWLEPAEHDFFKSYLCCIFVISAEEADPMSELARLVQKQNTQQHGGTESATLLGPAHCSSPKWFLPNILKHYVVLHDVSTGSDDNANQIFNKVAAMHGSDCCHLVKVNSETEASDLPDPWHQILEQRYRGLESGLELARRRLVESSSNSNDLPVDKNGTQQQSLPISATFSSSVTAPVFSTSSAALIPSPTQLPVSLPSPNSAIFTDYGHITSRSHGQYLSTSDRSEIRDFVEKFVKQALIPFVEKQIFAQNDILQNRRGIGKSFTSVRKWLSSASSTPASGQPIVYGAESAEIQTRRLADLAFLFGLYAFSHSLYQSVKKDFANDSAKLHQAGALEMATLTYFLSTSQVTAKQLPVRYLDAALNLYMNECMQPMLAVRCAMISIEILTRLSMNLEAANQLILLTSNRTNVGPNAKMLSDLFSGVLLEKTAALFLHAKMLRKRPFHLVLAGHRFSQAGQAALALRCYSNAAAEYFDKRWQYAEDHIIFTLAHNSKDPVFQVDCVGKLVKPVECRVIHPETQSAFIDYYIKVLSKNSVTDVEFVVPILVADKITVIYGEKPEYVEDEEKSKFAVEPEIKWEDLERACFHATAGLDKPFLRSCPMFSNQSTRNTSVKETPPFERFRVQFKLLNPMFECLTLKNLRLEIEDVVMRENASPSLAFTDLGKIDELVLAATELPSYNEMHQKAVPPVSETVVELHVIPSNKVMSFSVKNILFELASSDGICVAGKLPVKIQGKRLVETKEQRMSKVYSPDCRMSITVSRQKWPLLNVELSGQAGRSKLIHAYCSQIFQVMVTLENVGDIPLKAIAIASDQTEFVSISEPGADHHSWGLCKTQVSTANGVLYHVVGANHCHLEPKNKLTLRMAIKAPEKPVENCSYQILFHYLGENGYFREYRYFVNITAEPLLSCNSRVLNPDLRLCAIEVKNVIPNRDAVLAKVEFLRLKAVLTVADKVIQEADVNLDLVVKRQVTIESEQSDVIPFFVNKAASTGSSILWLTDSVYDIPSFNNVFKHQMEAGTRLYFSLLWKSHVAGSGNVVTLFGESRVENPFSSEVLTNCIYNQ